MDKRKMLSRWGIPLIVLLLLLLAFAPASILGKEAIGPAPQVQQPSDMVAHGGVEMSATTLYPIADTWIDYDYADGIY